MGEIDYDFFEAIILHNCLCGDSAYLAAIVDYIRPSYFADPHIGAVIKIIDEYYQARDKPPTLTEIKARLTNDSLRESFKHAVARIAAISKDPIDPFELVDNTEVWLRERIMLECVTTIANATSSGKSYDKAEIFTRMDQAQSISLIDGIGFDYFEQIDQHCAKLAETSQYISTGWAWLDKMLGGGWLRDGRALYLFCGVTNVGKSIFLGNIAVAALRQLKTVVLISLEMSEEAYGKRIDAVLTQVPINSLAINADTVASSLKEFKQANPEAKLIIKEYPPSSVTARQIDAYLHKLKRKGIKIDLIVLDYLNLLEPAKNTGSSYTDIKKTGEQVRALSYKYACPVITATQLNRGAYGVDDPGIETTSESIGLPQTVDAQFAIWNTEEDAQMSMINLGMMKSRFGPATGSTKLHLDYQTLTLSDAKLAKLSGGGMQQLLDSIGGEELDSAPVFASTPERSMVDIFTSGT